MALLIEVFDAGAGAVSGVKRNVKHCAVGINIKEQTENIVVLLHDLLSSAALQRDIDDHFIHTLRLQLIDAILKTLIDVLINHCDQHLVVRSIRITFNRSGHL